MGLSVLKAGTYGVWIKAAGYLALQLRPRRMRTVTALEPIFLINCSINTVRKYIFTLGSDRSKITKRDLFFNVN